MRGVNKTIHIGSLGADPETRQFSNGGSVTNITIACSEQWVDKSTGEKKEHTEWVRVTLFNRLGEIAAQYLRKGSKVYIEGSLRTRKWQDKNGQDRYTTEIRADQMQMLDSNQGQANTGYQQPAQQQQPPQTWGQQPTQAPQGFNNQLSGGQPSNAKDDDVPFMPHFAG